MSKTTTDENHPMGKEDENAVLKSDLEKIHARINQAVNHRFLLTGANIALIGPIIVPLTNGFTLDLCTQKSDFFHASIALSLYSLLSALFFYQSTQLRRVIRILATYLIVKELSEWEKDWSKFRSDPSHPKSTSSMDQSTHEFIFFGTSSVGIIIYIALFLVNWSNIENQAYILYKSFFYLVIIDIPLILCLKNSFAKENELEEEYKKRWENIFR